MDEKYYIYGVRNCEQNDKLIEILDEVEIEYEFFDFRDFPPTAEQLKDWGEFEEEDFPINFRSNLFKKNKKKFDKMDEEKKILWLQEHYHCLNRPIITTEQGEILSVGGRPERIAKTVFKLIKGF